MAVSTQSIGIETTNELTIPPYARQGRLVVIVTIARTSGSTGWNLVVRSDRTNSCLIGRAKINHHIARPDHASVIKAVLDWVSRQCQGRYDIEHYSPTLVDYSDQRIICKMTLVKWR